MKFPVWFTRVVAVGAVLAVAGIAHAGNVPSGLTGLWRFQSDADKLKATVGTDLTTSDPGNSTWMTGPWTTIEPGLSDGGVVQERSWDYLTVTHGIAPNGGGAYVNQYTVAIDYVQTSGVGLDWNSLYQTGSPHGNDGDLFIAPDGTIGIGDVGYSTKTFNPGQWHRIMWSVDNTDSGFFRVYVDGELYLDGASQGVDGRFSLDPTFHLFADDSWEDSWGLVGTAAVWDHALTGDEVAGMGGINTALVVPEPATVSLLIAAGALCGLKRRVRK